MSGRHSILLYTPALLCLLVGYASGFSVRDFAKRQSKNTGHGTVSDQAAAVSAVKLVNPRRIDPLIRYRDNEPSPAQEKDNFTMLPSSYKAQNTASTALPQSSQQTRDRWGRCESHPAHFPGLAPVLFKEVQYAASCLQDHSYIYVPRCRDIQYFPMGGKNASKYSGYDVFVADVPKVNSLAAITLHFHRPARVYLLLPASKDNANSTGDIPGFQDDGLLEIPSQGWPQVEFGISRTKSFNIPKTARAFYKTARDGTAVLPDSGWLNSNLNWLQPITSYVMLFSEIDGTSSPQPVSPAGVPPITAGKRCPEQLHDLWRIPGRDTEDMTIHGKTFQTWHPMWDPCYWCGYDHEHGSNAGRLMGVLPTYNYPSLKNFNQDEFHNGFKSFVFKKDGYLVSYDIHASLSQTRRFVTRFHSGILTIVDSSTFELMAQLTMKLDFGAAKVRTVNGSDDEAIHPGESHLIEEQKDLSPRERVFNIIGSTNYAELDPRYTYLDKSRFLQGQYEKWSSAFICSTENPKSMLKVDFRDPGTALRTASSTKEDPPMILGAFDRNNNVVPHLSMNRRLLTKNMQVGLDLCSDETQKIAKDGKWYTDPYGENPVAYPGKHRMQQYIKPGFSITLDGIYGLCASSQDGLYVEQVKNSFRDPQLTIDPFRN